MTLAGIAAVAVALGASARGSSQALADGAGLRPVETSLLALLNEERARHRLGPLHQSGTLARAARWQSRDMVTHRYFAHGRRGGPDLVQRIRRTGYLKHAGRWVVGENIGWAAGRLATPNAIVAGWMRSAGHRHNILDRTFESIGIGVVGDDPTGGRDAPALTVTTDFGFRSRR